MFWFCWAVLAVVLGVIPLMAFVMAWLVPGALIGGGFFLFLRMVSSNDKPNPSA